MDWYGKDGEQGSGHQGDTSEQAEPSRRRLVDVVGEEVRARGARGMTWREVADTFGMHHGQASSALSNLHRMGLAVRLQETRSRCGVYVTPENALGRATVAHRRNPRGFSPEQAQEIVRQWVTDYRLSPSIPTYNMADMRLGQSCIDDLIARFTR